ncbi:hypothetical protein [Microbispora rosea]|nr:hypothetical protein [Microbispora rosea]
MAPCTSTVSPGTNPAAAFIDIAVTAEAITLATAGSTPSGIGT